MIRSKLDFLASRYFAVSAAGLTLLNGGALQPAFAGQYEALCGGSNCTIVVTPTEVISPFGSIPAKRVTYWGGSGDAKTSVGTGVATTVILGPIGLLGFLAKTHQYNFTINGFDASGKQVSMQFEFKNDKPAKKLMQELPGVTGLGLGQTRTVDEIKAAESRGQDGPGVLTQAPTNIGPIGSPTAIPIDKSKVDSNCWSTYLDNNPEMKKWAESNPGQASQNKKRFNDC